MPKQITPTKTNKVVPTASTTATTTITAASPAIGKMLSVAQLLVLSTAAQRPDHMLLPLPSTLRLRGGGQTKLLAALVKAGLAEEVTVSDDALCWRRDADDQRIGLRLTEAGLAAVQIPAQPPATVPPQHFAPAPKAERLQRRARPSSPVSLTTDADGVERSAPPTTLPSAPDQTPAGVAAQPLHPGGKLGQVLSAVSASTGATLAELVGLTGWQAHTARAALTGLRHRGFAVQLSEQQGRKAYRLDAG
jgi:DNA-binding MarR family transcriptional regulator